MPVTVSRGRQRSNRRNTNFLCCGTIESAYSRERNNVTSVKRSLSQPTQRRNIAGPLNSGVAAATAAYSNSVSRCQPPTNPLRTPWYRSVCHCVRPYALLSGPRCTPVHTDARILSIDVSIPACPKLETSFRSKWPWGMLFSSSFAAILYERSKGQRTVRQVAGGNDCRR